MKENGEMSTFIPDFCRDQNKSNKAVDNYVHALVFHPDYYKTQKMWIKAVSTYFSLIQFASDQFKTQAVGTCPFVFDSVPDRYITQEMCEKVVSEDPFVKILP